MRPGVFARVYFPNSEARFRSWYIIDMLAPAVAAFVFVVALIARRFVRSRCPPNWICATAVAAASFGLGVTLALTKGFPGPVVQDEFSYLLGADTFAHGRLTNPPHPMGRYFQTFHVLTTPTYASKYPPGQGIVLAIGQLFGDPAVGVWLATAGLAGLAVWAAAGFVEPPVATLAGVAVAVHPQVVEWDRTFWGGTLAAIGGVVLIGALKRRKPLLVGVAAGIFLLTRPYEGAAALVVAMLVFRKWANADPAIRGGGLSRHPSWVVLAAFTPFTLFIAHDNYRVTGSPLKLPYLEYEHQYAAAPPLLLSPIRPVPAGIPDQMRRYAAQVELPHFNHQRASFGHAVVEKLSVLIHSFGGSTGWVGYWPLLLLVGLIDRTTWKPAAVVAGVVGATLVSNWTRSQYVAPAVGGLVVYCTVLARSKIGRAALSAVAAGWLVVTIQSAGVTVTQRDRIDSSLQAEPGKHLVIVKYLPGHRLDDEWVYNAADIDAAKVVWARDLGDPRPLLDYYPDRTVWEVTIDAEKAVPVRLRN